MKTLYLAVVCPVSGLTGNAGQICQAVWTKVVELLQPNLGKFYSSFYPASHAWGVKVNTPFGVVLGRDDPLRFVEIAAKATEAQDAAVDFHTKELLANLDSDQVHQSDDALICSVHLGGANREAQNHSVWHIGMATGAFLPDCGIYYMEQQRAIAELEWLVSIATNLANYAMCVVQMEVPVWR